MSASVHIRGGRVLCPAQGIDRSTDVFVGDGRILALGEPPEGFHAGRTLDARGLLVLPGLVDLGTNLREPGARHKADIVSELRAAAASGITTVCASPATRPAVDNTAVLELVQGQAHKAGASRLVPLGALTAGLDGEHLSQMAALKRAGCVAVSDGGQPVANTLVLRRALEYAATHDLPVMVTPQDPDLTRGSSMHEGWMATRLGIAGIPVAAETVALARTLALVEETGARVHFMRLSSTRGAELVARARRDGLPVSADVAMHQLFLTEMDASGYSTTANVLPPLRGERDRAALRQAVADGVIQAVCSDHQPHDADAKAVPFVAAEPGVSGLDTLLALALRLEDEGALPLLTAVERVTSGPAALLGLPGGTLRPGAPADICLVDPRAPWWVTPEALFSRGRNTPFGGWELTGRVRHTLVDGTPVYPEETAPA
ncbi:dihydroorotase [Aquisalimonas lutea]|uniref:dihydroorotase n=1 Tax=Aquisalimonas lutea TaxID=1327750 RepID=UPI0025B2CD97|nr:dihydroorotase [Aquisalimonas lutea]MDN3516114.1 dihydroorotase [Aquisalimonas lutea]